MKVFNIVWRNCKWRFQNPATIMMNIVQPIIWFLLFGTIFNPLGNETNYTEFIFPALLIMSVIMSAGVGCGMGNYSIKADGSFYRIYIAPIKRSSIILGQILDTEILSFIGIVVLFLLSIPFSIKIESGLLGLLLIVLILFSCVFFVACFSYVMSSLLPDENAFIGLMNTITLPLFFVSSALMPLEKLPTIFQSIAKVNPFTYAIDCIRELFSSASIPWGTFGLTFSIFIVLGAIFFLLAVKKLYEEQKSN